MALSLVDHVTTHRGPLVSDDVVNPIDVRQKHLTREADQAHSDERAAIRVVAEAEAGHTVFSRSTCVSGHGG